MTERAAPPPVAGRAAAASTAGLRVLLVEDDARDGGVELALVLPAASFRASASHGDEDTPGGVPR
jgi:hypothetical protein